MPELPEVETVMQGLRPHWQGNTLESVEIRRSGLRWPFPDGFCDRLSGCTIQALYRRAKYILGDLSNGQTLLIHLGMTGRMTHQNHSLGQFVYETRNLDKHDHVVFRFQDGAETIYNDVRRFGAMDLFTTQHPLLDELGYEPLAPEFTPEVLHAILENRSSSIKAVLLNQKYVAGLGNIYVCEALFQSGIHPEKPALDINEQESKKLHAAIQDVLKRAIAAGGSSLKDYRQSDGNMGYFQHNFLVYGREGKNCTVCPSKVERIVQNGRSTFFCKQCQL